MFLLVLVLASRNRNKIRELKDLLQDVATIKDVDDYPGMPEVAETGSTFTENAILKATAVSEYTGLAALADDSGLEVKALDGAPGVNSARFSGPGATDASNRGKLLAELHEVASEDRHARFVCCVALVVPGEPVWTACGTHEGRILESPAGTGGFGYDPLFYSFELQATFAQVAEEAKNRVSHRARAIDQLYEYLHDRKVRTRGFNRSFLT